MRFSGWTWGLGESLSQVIKAALRGRWEGRDAALHGHIGHSREKLLGGGGVEK
jgi:hypothetical protein